MKTQTFAQAQARYDAMEPLEDPYDDSDLTEKPIEELEALLWSAECSATDPEVPHRVRHLCDEACLRLTWEIARRRRAEDKL